MSDKKPRKFFLLELFNSQHGYYYETGNESKHDFHVIEYKAYTDALKKIAELELALTKIKENSLSYKPSACDISEIASEALGKHSV